jgi:hypothetical protein
VKAAAGVYDPFGLKVGAVKQIPNEGIGIVDSGSAVTTTRGFGVT